jgi:hypothetical protein
LGEILNYYVQPFEALDLAGSSTLPASLRGQTDILFGNIRELVSSKEFGIGVNCIKSQGFFES